MARNSLRGIFDFALVAGKEPKEISRIKPLLREKRDVILRRLASGDKILRTTFSALETLEYRPTYDQCVEKVKKALKG